MLRRLLFAAALLLPPLLVRLASLIQQEVQPGAYDLLGVASDLGIAAVLLFALGLLRGRAARPVAAIAVVSLAGIQVSNYEHIRALNTSLDIFSLKFLGDATFLRGTMHVSSLALTLLLFALPLALLVAARGLERSWRWLVPIAGLGLILLALTSLLPPRVDLATWRQYNMVQQNLLGLAQRALAKSEGSKVLTETEDAFHPPSGLTEAERDATARLLAPDLTGEPALPLGQGDHNVLLIILEAVSGAYLEILSAEHNRSSHYQMPRLSGIAVEGIAYRGFVSHQRRTNRGEYSLLCGDYPNLGLKKSKMDYYALEAGAARPCLPAALSAAGFQTVYLQSAPLGFMFKDRFMKRAGFDEVLGMAWFEQASAWSAWGPDDRTFFQQSLRKVDALRAEGRPWFLTLLTSGTHHPYHVDPAFKSEHKPGSLGHAIAYLDLAVEELIAALRQRGVFEDTLVLVTCDESNGLRSGGDLARILSQNWGLMLAFAPGAAPALIDERYMQADVAISVLDYLGLDAAASGFGGRSLFRRYPQPRSMLFGNVYRNRLGFYRADGAIVLCSNLLTDCQAYAPSGPELVPASATASDPVESDRRLLQSFLASNELGVSGGLRDSYQLARLGSTALRSQNARYVVFGYQYLDIPADTDLRVEVEVTVERGAVHLVQDLASGGGKRRHFSTDWREVSAGQTLRVAYTFGAGAGLDKAEVRLFAENRSGAESVFNVKVASLELKPMRRGLSGIVEQNVEVSR